MTTQSNVKLIKLLSDRYKFDANDAIEYVKTASKKGRPKKEIEVEHAKDLFDKILEDAGEAPLEKDPALYKKFEKAPDKVNKDTEKEAKKQEKEKKAAEKEKKKQEKPAVKATPKEKPVEPKKINQYIVTFHQPDGKQIIDIDDSIDKPLDFIHHIEHDTSIGQIIFLDDKYLNKYADLVGKKSTDIDADEQGSVCFVETTEVTKACYNVVYEKKSYIVKFHNILNILPAKPVNQSVTISNHVSNDDSSDDSSDDEEEIKPQEKEVVVIKHTPIEQLMIGECGDNDIDEEVNRIIQSVMKAKMERREANKDVVTEDEVTDDSEEEETDDEEDEEEQEEVEVVKVKRVKINGKDYLKSSNNVLYDIDSNDAIGVWDENKQEIILNELDEDSYDEEDNE